MRAATVILLTILLVTNAHAGAEKFLKPISPVIPVASTFFSYEYDGDVDISAYGNGIRVWMELNDTPRNYYIYARCFSDSGVVTDKFRINEIQDIGSHGDPVTAVNYAWNANFNDADAFAMVAWRARYSTTPMNDNSIIAYRKIPSSICGQDLTNTAYWIDTATDGDQSMPDIAVAPDGYYAIVYRQEFDNISDKEQIKLYIGEEDNLLTGKLLTVTTVNDGVLWYPRVSISPADTISIVWVEKTNNGQDVSINYAHYDKEGVLIKSGNAASESYSNDTYATVAIDSSLNGGFAVMWATEVYNFSSSVAYFNGVFTKKYDSSGVATTPIIQVAGSGSNVNRPVTLREVDVSYDWQNYITYAWVYDNNTYIRRLSPDNSWYVEPVIISDAAGLDGGTPSIDHNVMGETVLAGFEAYATGVVPAIQFFSGNPLVDFSIKFASVPPKITNITTVLPTSISIANKTVSRFNFAFVAQRHNDFFNQYLSLANLIVLVDLADNLIVKDLIAGNWNCKELSAQSNQYECMAPDEFELSAGSSTTIATVNTLFRDPQEYIFIASLQIEDRPDKYYEDNSVEFVGKVVGPLPDQNLTLVNEQGASVSIYPYQNVSLDQLEFIVSGPLHGDLVLKPNHVVYYPDSGFVGNDSFKYYVKHDASGFVSNEAIISIIVSPPPNAPPVASNGVLTLDQDKIGYGTLMATDADGDNLTFSIVAGAQHGTVSMTDAKTGGYKYTPASDYSGTDSFTFKTNDGVLDSNVATVSITINKINSGSGDGNTTPPTSGSGGEGGGGIGLWMLAWLLGARILRSRRA